MSLCPTHPLSAVPFTGADGKPCLRVEGVGIFDTGKTFDCGQCFRFDPVPTPTHRVEYGGVVGDRWISVGQDAPGTLFLHNVTLEFFDTVLRRYLDLDRDYDTVDRQILKTVPGTVMARAVSFGRGIRILRQDGFETLCSFILSQNNNIPRIKRMIAALCRTYGKPLDGDGIYAFPTPAALAGASEAELRALGMGFRAPYLRDAACKWAEGWTATERLADLPYETAEAILCEIRGVGPKVAACTLLFGFGHTEGFPVDVWIRKVLDAHFGGTFPVAALGCAAGIAQQYLFYLGRYSDLFSDT